MTFDQSILVWCVCVPGVIAGVTAFATRCNQPRNGLLAAVGWWLAVTVAMAGCQGWQWWPDDAWRQATWPILAWCVLLSGTATWPVAPGDRELQVNSLRWLTAGVLACLTALVAMPSGDEWSDTFHLHRVWMCGVAVSCLLNSFSLESIARRGGERWCLLVALAGLGGPMVLAASTYGSLAQWTLAVIVATLVMAVHTIVAATATTWAIVFPVVAAAAGITAAGRFYSYEDHSPWIYALMLFGPTLVAIIDYPIRNRPTRWRVTASGIVSLLIVGTCIAAVLDPTS